VSRFLSGCTQAIEFDNNRIYDYFMYLPFFIGLLSILGSVFVVEPEYPMDAVAGGTVVAAVTSVNGAVQNVDLLYSDPPFADPAESALARWRFESKGTQETLVIVHFRYSQIYLLGPAKQEIPQRKHPESLPYPRYIVQPPYPVNLIGQASVVFYLDITERGTVSNVRVVRTSGDLTAGIDTVKKWEFLPAHDASGKNVPTNAYVVIAFRPPVTEPAPEH
jgi:hypothetical protein